ncbi:chemotaxis protein CheA, partial [Aliarcobacter cryaerophilus]
MSFDISKYREMFLEEAAELFESADNVLLMGQLFRDVHTLKGSGASVELAFFAEFTHDVENLMDKLRSHKIEYQPEMAETLIDGLDVMKEILELEVSNQINKEKFQELTSSLLEEIRAYSNGSTTNKKEEEQITQSVKVLEKIDTPISDEKEEFGFFSDDLNSQRDRKDMPFGIFEDDDTDDENIGFYDEELENISNNTDDNKFKIDENKENFGFFDGMEKISPNSVMEINDIESETSNENKIAEQEKKDLPTTVSRRAKENSDDTEKKSISNNNNSIRVNLDKIDLLMNNVGDLVITNAMLTQFSSTIEESKTRGSVLERLELLERHIRDMQDSIMSIRMVPMDSIYSKFPKVVRDISKRLGKKVEFKHYGDNVEIDKAMIEGLTDPLMHIIRNSLDHGIEMPEDRIKAGKSDTGTISISAEQANGQMIITIEDDG